MAFGKPALPLWPLDPAATYLNHGTVGVTPKHVLEVQQQWRERIERHPSRFMLRELWTFRGVTPAGPTLLRQAAAKVATFVGAETDNLVFVDNTTTGVNAIVRSLPLEPGDDLVVTDHAYGGIVSAIRYAADRAGATVTTVNVPYPAFDPAELVGRIRSALTPRTRLVITDHVVSETALIFPVRQIVEACHDRGVPVLVDGAHVPGALPLDLSAIGADFYVANLHKWAMAPRSCAFLAVLPAFQRSIHPAVISWGFDAGFTQEFDWVGTRDPTPWLCAPDGIAFLESLGLDALLIDTHPGLNEEALLTMRAVGTLIVVLRPDTQDFEGTGVTVQVARQLEVPRVVLIVNQVPSGGSLQAVRARARKTFDSDVLAVIPQSTEFMGFEEDVPFVVRHPQHPVSLALQQVALALQRAKV